MGAYCHLTRLIAHDDLPSGDRQFMQMLWERVYSQPGWEFMMDEALRQPVHDELRLPGTLEDWEFLRPQHVGERLYWIGPHIGKALQPPFPRWFSGPVFLSERIPCRPLWHALFADIDTSSDAAQVFRPLSEARDRFCRLSFPGFFDGPFLPSLSVEALRAQAPEGSVAWHRLRQYLSLFRKGEWIDTMHLLLSDSGPNALLELSFWEEFVNPLTPREFQEIHRAYGDLFAAYARWDLSALSHSPVLQHATEDLELIADWANETRHLSQDYASYFLLPEEAERLGLTGVWAARKRYREDWGKHSGSGV